MFPPEVGVAVAVGVEVVGVGVLVGKLVLDVGVGVLADGVGLTVIFGVGVLVGTEVSGES